MQSYINTICAHNNHRPAQTRRLPPDIRWFCKQPCLQIGNWTGLDANKGWSLICRKWKPALFCYCAQGFVNLAAKYRCRCRGRDARNSAPSTPSCESSKCPCILASANSHTFSAFHGYSYVMLCYVMLCYAMLWLCI